MIDLLKQCIPNSIKQSLGGLFDLKRNLPVVINWCWKMRNDPMFKLCNVDSGLLQRPTFGDRSEAQRLEVAKRIVNAYQLAIENQAQKKSVYKVSNEWVPIFQKPLKPLLVALEKGDAIALRDVLDNFFRNSVSAGLIGLPVDMSEVFFGGKPPGRMMRTRLLIDQVYRYRLLEKLIPHVQPEDLYIEDVGNPYGLQIDNKFIRIGADYQFYYANRVKKLLDHSNGRSIVAELGGGIGGFAYYLKKCTNDDVTYINMDLPEILCISAYQLLNLLPEKRIALYGEVDCYDTKSLLGFDLLLMPSFIVESIPDNSVDVVFNSYSLAEMDQPTIWNYTKQLSRVCKKTIMHVNHVRDSLVSANDFPFDKEKFSLISCERAEWNLGRNLRCDEYEFLYEKISPGLLA